MRKARGVKRFAALRGAETRPAGAFGGCGGAAEPFARSGKETGRGSGRGDDRSCGKTGEEGSGAESGSEKTKDGGKENRQAGKEKAERINHADPSLSDYWPDDHHGKTPGRERDAAHRGV